MKKNDRERQQPSRTKTRNRNETYLRVSKIRTRENQITHDASVKKKLRCFKIKKLKKIFYLTYL